MTITQKFLQDRVDRLNRMAGFDPESVEYNTVGAYGLEGAYGGVALFRIKNEAGGVEGLTHYMPGRELNTFIEGMFAAIYRKGSFE